MNLKKVESRSGVYLPQTILDTAFFSQSLPCFSQVKLAHLSVSKFQLSALYKIPSWLVIKLLMGEMEKLMSQEQEDIFCKHHRIYILTWIG